MFLGVLMTVRGQADRGDCQSLDFELKSGDSQFQALLVEPLLSSFQDSSGLVQQLFVRLGKHGLKLADVKFEAGGGTLAEVQWTCCLIAYSVIVRIRLDNVEVHCFNFRAVTQEQLGDVIVGALEAVKSHVPTAAFKLYTLSYGLHGLVAGTPAVQFLASYAHPPEPELGPLTGSGAVFYYGETTERARSTLVVDLSAAIDNGVYVRPTAVWDASRVAIGSLPGLATAFVHDALRQVGLILR